MAYDTYALVRVNKKGQKELEILRPVTGDVFLIESGAIKRNLNEGKFGLGVFEAGEVVVACFIIKASYHKLLYVRKVEEMGHYISVRLFSGISKENLQKVDGIHAGFAALLRLAADASSVTGSFHVVPLPLSEEASNNLAAIINTFGEAKISKTVKGEDVHPNVSPAPAPSVAPKVHKPGYYYVSKEVNLALTSAVRTLKAFGGASKSVNIAMLGHSGYGKTSLAKKLAEKLNFAFVRLNCALIGEPEEIAVKRGLKDGSTTVELKRFAQVLIGGNAVIVLDELTRAYPNVLNSLFALLDGEGEEEFFGEKVVVGDNVVFVATMNVGNEYTGTFKADLALVNRFQSWVVLNALPSTEEIKVLCSAHNISENDARTIVTMAQEIRRQHNGIVEVSTRTTLNIALFVSAGLSVRQAFEFVVVNSITDDGDKRVIYDALNFKLDVVTTATNIKLLF